MSTRTLGRWFVSAALAFIPTLGCGTSPAEVALSAQSLEALSLSCEVAADPAGTNSKCDGKTLQKASYQAPASPVGVSATSESEALAKCVAWAQTQPAGSSGQISCGTCPTGCKKGGCEPFDIKGSDSLDVRRNGSGYDCGTHGEINVVYKCTKCQLAACAPAGAAAVEAAASPR